MKSNKSGFFSNLKYDLPAGIVVFLVALPLCLGIALASDAPMFSGLIAGIIGGTVVALASGSPLGVSGPAAGLAVIVASAIQDLGGFEIFLAAVVLGGLIQLVLGFVKAGIIGYYFPSSVIKGMLAGIGIIIIMKEIPHFFGYDKDAIGDFEFFQMDGHNTFSDLSYMWDTVTPLALIIASTSLAILILWEQKFIKKNRVLGLFPGALLAVVAGVLINYFSGMNGRPGLIDEHLVNIPIAESFNGFIGQFTLPDFSAFSRLDVWVVAGTIAVVASLETLLCVEATDKLDPQKRITPTNRELIAQGSGNMLSGLIGGLPITQVIVRSSANIQSGGKSKASAFFHGILLLVCVAFIPSILNLIPLASLAAVLFVVGYKLAKPTLFKTMWKSGWEQFVPFIVTIGGIVFKDLLVGIALGIVVAIIIILRNNFRTPFHFSAENHKHGEPYIIELGENLSFLNKAGILHSLMEIEDGANVIIDASRTRTMHADIVEILDDFANSAESRNITFEIKNLSLNQDIKPIKDFGKVVNNGNGNKNNKK